MPTAAERILLIDQGDQAIGQPPPARGKIGKQVSYGDALRGEPVRVVATLMSLDERRPAAIVLVQVAETLNKRNRLARDILASVFLAQLLLIALASATVYFGIGCGIHPLQRLQRALSARSHLDLSPIKIDKVPGEVRPLVEEMNRLLQRLGRTLDFQNRFIADAAHQLKTPIAGIKAQIELALRESDRAKLQHSVAQLYVSADRLSRLVGQLLSLARNEPGAVESIQIQALDLNALALEVTMEWVPEALKRNIDLGFEDAGHEVIIDGDLQRLRELINNLIDNAVRYNQDNGRATVRVAAATKGNIVRLVIGLGISIPLIIYGSTLILKLMTRFPVIITTGAGLLGWVAGEMAFADPRSKPGRTSITTCIWCRRSSASGCRAVLPRRLSSRTQANSPFLFLNWSYL